MKRQTYFYSLILLFMTSCIGTDLVDEPLGPVPARIELSNSSIVLLEGESQQLSAQVISSDDSSLEKEISWSSRNPSIATIDAAGLLNAVAEGQVWIDVLTETLSDSLLVTVSANAEDLASVTITTAPMELAIGDSLQLEVELTSASGTAIFGRPVTWNSSDPNICSVNNNGLVIALANGTTQIRATSEDINSLPVSLMVGAPSLTRGGTFRGLNGYTVSGTATIERSADRNVVVFSNDFRTQNGPGLYVYISPNATNVSGGINLGNLQATSGTQTYPIPDNLDPESFDHVLVYCQPFRAPFGTAALE
ncbi:MAG: DM13 domain-containing protein [Bacteroidota bacterium]